MERESMVAVALAGVALILGWISNQMLLGLYAALLVIVAAIGYKIWVAITKKSSE